MVFGMTESGKEIQAKSAYLHLRRLLLHGQLLQGKRLTETKWSQRLGVTRSALREGMSLLVHEGLLERGAKGGFFVPLPRSTDMNEVLEVRLTIELGALRIMTFDEREIPDVSHMREVCNTMTRMMEEQFHLGFEEADRRFHELLVSACGNERLFKVYMQAPLPLMEFSSASEVDSDLARKKTISEHLQICDLMAEKQLDAAGEVLVKHLMTGSSKRKHKDGIKK